MLLHALHDFTPSAGQTVEAPESGGASRTRAKRKHNEVCINALSTWTHPSHGFLQDILWADGNADAEDQRRNRTPSKRPRKASRNAQVSSSLVLPYISKTPNLLPY